MDLLRVNGMPRFDGREKGDNGSMLVTHEGVFELPSSDRDVFELPSSDHGVDGADYFARGSRPSSAKSTPRKFGGELESPAATHELQGSSVRAAGSPPTNVVLPIRNPVSNRSSTVLSPLNSGSASPSPTPSLSLGSAVVTPARSPLNNVVVLAREDAGRGTEMNEENRLI